MTRYFFSNTANQLSLSAGVVSTATALPFSGTATGWPSTPCKAVIDPDSAVAEVVKITAIGGSSFTVVRGQDGTTAQSHTAGAVIEHRWSASEADEANLHANSSSGVHGLTGAVAGVTDSQTLTNKTLTSPVSDTATARASASAPAISAKAAATGTANIQEWQDSAGVRLSRVGQHGDVLVNTNNSAFVPLLLKSAAGQSVSHLEVRDSTDRLLFQVDSKGRVRLTPSDTSITSFKFVPPDSTTATAFNIKDTTDTTDQFVLTTLGEITTAAKVWLRGVSTDDPIRFPVNGTKFKVDTNGAVTAAGDVTTAGNIKAANSVTRLTRTTTDGTGASSAGTTENVSASQPSLSLVSGRRYRFHFFAVAGSNATDLIACRLRISTGTVTRLSTLVCETQVKITTAGGPGQISVFACDEFVATSTGTWHIAAGADTINGGGDASALNWYAIVDEVGV